PLQEGLPERHGHRAHIVVPPQGRPAATRRTYCRDLTESHRPLDLRRRSLRPFRTEEPVAATDMRGRGTTDVCRKTNLEEKSPDFSSRMARAGLEPATPRFSAECSTS